MRIQILISTIFGLLLVTCKEQKPNDDKAIYKSETLRIEQLTDHCYLHTSYLSTNTLGKVPCNGIFVVNDNETIVVDTPPDDKTANELIAWIESNTHSEIKAVVATHFHVDCLGGLGAFHEQAIPSFGSNATLKFALSDSVLAPQNGFDYLLKMHLGDKKLIHQFLGEGHTKDNIVSYFPHDKVLFGGCLVKSDGAGKGNLKDANVEEWSNTVEAVKSKYREASIVVPGHGKVGDLGLLDYTVRLFRGE